MSIDERSPEPRGGELLELLRSRSPFDSLSGPLLMELVDACEVLDVRGGTRLLRAGQLPDSLYGVLNGALRLVRRDNDGVEQSIGEFYRGDMLGFIGMFLEHPVPAEIVVVRDSTLVRLARERFLALTEKEPVLMRAVLRVLSENISDLLGAMTGARKELAPRHAGNLGLITLSRDAAVRGTVEQLVRVMTLGGAAVRVTAEDVDAALGAGAAENEDRGSRVTRWLDNLESEAGAVIYESGPLQRTWATRCVRQSDRLLVVVASGDEGRIDEIATMLTRATTGGLSRQVHFLLVHPRETELPSGTRVWSRIAGVTRVHHVRSGERRDLERVARHVFGRSIGVALSGGGARGIAHLGVLAAMAEADIPIDYICGTSMGAIFAAGAALGWNIERLRDEVRKVFAPPLALYDVTVPVSAFLKGKKLDRVMQRLYGDADIEDLWLPFFCVSTDLTRAMLVVHDRGTLWKSVRASCSIPGLFPPLPEAGRVLVDGGLMDNLPIDLLAERCQGPIIAVDVFAYGDPTLAQPAGAVQKWLRGLRSRVKGEPAGPPLFDILTRSTFVGSRFRQETAAARLAQIHYLAPPVATFGLLRWRAHEQLFEAGYEYAKARLREPPFVDLSQTRGLGVPLAAE